MSILMEIVIIMKWGFLRNSPYINISLLRCSLFKFQKGKFQTELHVCMYLYINTLKYRLRKYRGVKLGLTATAVLIFTKIKM